MPYDTWAGFAYCDLNWSPKDFWSATVWDIISAMIFHNKKHSPKKTTVETKKLSDFMDNMAIKGLV